MRTFSPVPFSAAVLAACAGAAFAATTAPVPTGGIATPPTAIGAPGAPGTTQGFIPFTGSATTGVNAVTAAPSTANATASSAPSSVPAAGAANTTTQSMTTDASSFGPNSSFTNDSGNAELGTSPGQTSSGTAAGNAGAALDVGSATLGTNGAGQAANAATLGATPGIIVPDFVGGYLGGGPYGVAPVGASASTTVIASNPTAATPLLDQVTRNEERREARRRAEHREPRVIGIAPRTNADRTDEMPDDPIIRY